MSFDSLRRAWRASALLGAFVALAGTAAAQNGTLSGTVVDGDLRETLPGANVAVVGTSLGASADLDGAYRLSLPAGTYTVRYSFVGLETQLVNAVEVRAGATTELNVVLDVGASTVELVVEADPIIEQNHDVGLDRLRAGSSAVSDAVSGETISQSGSSNAGDAMERVTGASVQGGRYVYVRGLGDRYANTQLNGSALPTADPDRRSVQFDLFPASFLENIVTLKTFTPDRPGSFSGGLVDITTRSFPDEFTASVSVSSGLSTQISPGGTMLADPAAGVSLFGTATALELPDALLDGTPFPTIGRNETFNVEASPERLAAIRANEALTDYFSQRSVAPVGEAADPNVSVAASVGNRVPVLGNDLGFILGFTLDRGVGSYEEGVVGRYDVSGAEGSPRLRQSRRDQRSTLESNVGGIGSVTYRLGSRNEIGLNTLFSRSAESQARIISGPAPLPIGGEGDTTTFVTDRVTGYTERQLLSGQLRGRHEIAVLAGLRAEWRASYAVTSLDEPDLRFFANANTADGFQIGGAGLNNTLHFFRESTESLGGLGLDLTLAPRSVLDLPVQIKVGGLYETTARDFRERRFEVLSEGLTLTGEGPAAVDSLYSPENSGVVDELPPNPFDPQQRTTFVIGNRLVDGTQPNNQYAGALDVGALYAMAEFPVFRGLRVIGGARLERTDLGIDVVDLVTGAPVASEDSTFSGSIAETDLLPSLNLVYALSSRMNLRAAATRTLARPTFREIAPFESFDFVTDGPLIGNPDLDRTLITNLDLRWEWFNAPGSILAVSGYYKFLDRPIERVIVDIENNVNQFLNVDQATIFGAEFEARQRLAALGGPFGAPVLRDLQFGGNLTVTRSEITIAEAELAERRFIDPDATDRRALQGQSPFLVNLDLSYETAATTAGVYFNVFGRRLSRVGVPDVFEDPAPQLDFVATQSVFDQFSLKLSVKNILGSRTEEVYDFPESTYAAIGGRTPVYQSYDLGTSYSLGISFRPRFGGDAGPAIPPVPDTGGPLGAAATP
jgi:outer membrane receptor protein involved in Fe transport